MSIQNSVGYLLLILLCIFIIVYNKTDLITNTNHVAKIEGFSLSAPTPSSELPQFQLYNLIDYRTMDKDMWQIEEQIMKIQEVWPLNINSVNVSSAIYNKIDKLNRLQSMCPASNTTSSLSWEKLQNTNSPVVHPPNLEIKYDNVFPNIKFDFTLIKADMGPQGNQGEQGEQGDPGSIGPQGSQGPNGYWNMPMSL